MIKISKTMRIILIATLATFAVCLVALGISFAVETFGGGSYSISADGGGGGGSKGDKNPSVPAGSTVSEAGKKTGIKLPCATEDKTFLAPTGGFTDISSDTDIKSAAIVLVDITDNRTVAGRNTDIKVYPASMTKVMTLLVACENAADSNQLVTVTKEMTEKYKNSQNKGASVAFTWEEGFQVTVEDLLHLVIYQSDTYACWLLAECVAGGEEQFVELMNKRAGELGLSSTHFTNCTGLYNAEHYTTVREMAAIMAAAMNNKAAESVLTKTELYTVDIYKNGEKADEKGMWSAWFIDRCSEYGYQSTNPQYAGKGSDIWILGGKTGYEDVPTSCFVTAAWDDVTQRKYVCVQVGRINSEQPTIDTKTSTYDTKVMYQKYAKEPE